MNDDTPVIQTAATPGDASPQPDAGRDAAPKRKRSKSSKAAAEAAIAATEARIGYKFSDHARLTLEGFNIFDAKVSDIDS